MQAPSFSIGMARSTPRREHHYLMSEQEFVWLRGAREGVARMARAGLRADRRLEPAGVARGLVAPTVLRAIEERIQRDLAAYRCAI